MEELWKSYTRPPILKGKYPFSLPPDRDVYLTSVRDMGRLAGSRRLRPPPRPFPDLSGNCPAGSCLAGPPPPADGPLDQTSRARCPGHVHDASATSLVGRVINVASEVSTPAGMAEAFAAAQGTPCEHKQARLLRWIARLFLPDLYEVIQFYRTSTETTDVAALERQFPGLLTPFAAFLEETRWGDAEATYEDLAGAGID